MIRFRMQVAAVAAFAAMAFSYASANDWPQWRGPDRTGISQETGLLKSWPAGGPKLLWQRPLGKGFSAVSVVGDTAFTMYQNGSGQYAVALNVATGKTKWEVRTGPPQKYGGYPGPRATPTVDGDRAYFFDGDGNLLCLKTATGEKVWAGNALKAFHAKNLQWAVSMSPLVMGDRLIVNVGQSQGSSVVSLDKMTGDYGWKSLNDKAGYSSLVLANINGQKQLVFFLATGAAGLNPANGRPLWRFPWKTNYDVHAATPIVHNNRVFISSGYGVGCALFEVQPGNQPKQIWRNKLMKAHFSTPVLQDGYIYGFDMSLFRCLSWANGKSQWQVGGFGKGALIIVDGLAYVLGKDGRTALAKLSPQGMGKISEFRAPLSGKCWTMPVVANGRLYMRNEQKIVCYDVKAP